MQPPDEGMIHAWLDGELPADQVAEVERLVREDAAWAAAAAEARGLVANASRVIAALDDAPGARRAQVPTPAAPTDGVTPMRRGFAPRIRWRAAATIAVLIGGAYAAWQGTGTPDLTAPPVEQAVPSPAAAVTPPPDRAAAVSDAANANEPPPPVAPSPALPDAVAETRETPRVADRAAGVAAGRERTAMAIESEARGAERGRAAAMQAAPAPEVSRLPESPTAAKTTAAVPVPFACAMVLLRDWTPPFAGAPDTLRVGDLPWTPIAGDSLAVALPDGTRLVVATATRAGRAARATSDGVVHRAVVRCP